MLFELCWKYFFKVLERFKIIQVVLIIEFIKVLINMDKGMLLNFKNLEFNYLIVFVFQLNFSKYYVKICLVC